MKPRNHFRTPLALAASAVIAITLHAAPPVLFDFDGDNGSMLKPENGARVEVSGGEIILSFDASGGYPGVDIPPPDGTWDLSAFSAIEAEIVNDGPGKVGVNMRVDNPGDWRQSPWNTETVWMEPGTSRPVRVTFGESFGRAGYALDASRISNIKIFTNPSSTDGSLKIQSLTPVGSASERPAPAAAAAPQAAAPTGDGPPDPAPDNPNSPSIGGEIFPITADADLSRLKTQDSKVSIVQTEQGPRLKVDFAPGNYPNVQFPCPAPLGWNLQAFAGLEVEVTNTGSERVRAALRVDNPGDWKNNPWNTELTYVGPGETKTIQLTFGKEGSAPGFPLEPTRVTGVQLFLERPKQATTMLVGNVKGHGSGSERLDQSALTSPADRNKPVTPPDWLGKRPPVEGDWVMTLDENFEGNRIDESRWTPRFPWDGPQPGQLQRYAPENVTVKDGKLIVTAEKKAGHENNDPSLDRREYTSGLIQSYDKWAQLYGYFEARIKLPTARGLWPAFWMMPDRGKDSGLDMWARRTTSNQGMEIDILEHLTEWGPGRNNVATHWDGYDADHKSWGTTHIYFGPTPDGWHTFGLLWEPGKLTWYIDGKKVQVWENDRIASVPAYLKLNIQMGGWATGNVDNASLPDSMQVDYVRAWQLRNRM